VPPPISLLIPCFNAARYLPRLMESVQAGTQSFAAILCYDDGSTDDTVAVAHALGLDIITGNPNGGVARARNRLAATVQTEWIHFHDADDLLGSRFVERLGSACDDRHDVVTCDADWVHETTRQLEIAWRYDPGELAHAPLPYLLGQGMSLNSSIIRRSAWQAVGGCDEQLAIWEDADVHIRLAANSGRFFHVPEVHTWSLRHGDSFSHDYLKNTECRLHALEKYAATLSSMRAVIGEQAEIAADGFLTHGSEEGARRAIALCRRLGHAVPSSNQWWVHLARVVLPPLLLLKWRHRRRNV
jgi:glycosyltransferase involved in cell wall biosynthesis